MKKKLTSLVLSAIMTAAAIPAYQVNALDPPIFGDVNWDWQITIADLVCMKNYLLGNYELNVNQLYYNDLNTDGKVDVFDYILLDDIVKKNNGDVQKCFTRCAMSVVDAKQYSKYHGDAVINSVEELKEYFQPTSVISTSGECYIFDVASQEVIDDFLKRYNDNFFANNVLYLNFLKGVDKYTYKSVKYEGNDLVIEYYDSSDPNLEYFNPLPPYIAEVAIPKNMILEGNVIWKEVKRPFDITVRTNYTTAVEDGAVSWAISDHAPAVIKNTTELDEFISDKFSSGVKKSLTNTYNEEYFEKNVLILDIFQHGYRDDFIVYPTAGINKYSELEIVYDREFINGFIDSTLITQLSIPKEQYYDMNVRCSKTWETRTTANYYEYELNDITGSTDLIKEYTNKSQWIRSEEEAIEFLSDTLTDKGIEFLRPAFENTDWSSKALYVWIDDDISGSSRKLASASQSGDKFILTFEHYQPLGCLADMVIRVAEFDNYNAGKEVIEKNFNISNGYPHSGDNDVLLEFSCGKNFNTVLLNQYRFGDVDTLDIYKLHPGGGPVRYWGYDLIGSIDISGKNQHFYSEPSGVYTEDEESGKSTYTAENYSVTYTVNDDSDELTFRYTDPDTNEIVENTFTF